MGTSLLTMFEIALSARMSAFSFAGSLRCTLTLIRNVAAPAVVHSRRSSIASCKRSRTKSTSKLNDLTTDEDTSRLR